MKSDLYTKVILTIIAVALVGILLKNTGFIQSARAAKPSETMDVNIVSTDPSAFDHCVVPVRGSTRFEGGGKGDQPVSVEVTNTEDFGH